MSLKDILAIVTSHAANEHVIALAEQLTAQNAGRLSVALANWLPNVAPVDGYVFDPSYGDLVKDAERQLGEARANLEKRLGQEAAGGVVEPHLIEFGVADI